MSHNFKTLDALVNCAVGLSFNVILEGVREPLAKYAIKKENVSFFLKKLIFDRTFEIIDAFALKLLNRNQLHSLFIEYSSLLITLS